MIALTMILGFFVVGAIGLFAFEVNRILLAHEQLRAASDAAALAAAAGLASQDNTDPLDAHNEAMNIALNTFRANSVIGVPLSSAVMAADAYDSPAAGNSSIFVEFLDPHNNNTPVSLGDPAGKIVRITAAFGAQPAFGHYLGLGNMPVRVNSSGGVPDLDVVLCFDVSGSIDDQTPVTFVKRRWNSVTGKIAYDICSTRAGSPVQPLAHGKIYDILGPPKTGTRTNGVAPQYLINSNQSDVRWPLNFCENMSVATGKGLRGTSNAGSPPGNYPPNSGGVGIGDAYTYTDLVVNIDGNATFAGFSHDGYNFPDLATLVEASRGNLENITVFTNSKANLSVPAYITPVLGYQQAYYDLAKQQLHPLADAQLAAQDFFTIMNTNTDGHFSMICFSDIGGTSSTYTYNDYKVSSNYTAGGSANYNVPGIPLNPSVGQTQFSACTTAIPGTVATTGTNIGDAVSKAVSQLRTNSRAGCKKAIVLFTDGMPTVAGPLDGSDPWRNARLAANQAKTYGMPIYTIGLAQNPEIVPDETAILNDSNNDPNTGGMAGIAGNGGKFFLVTDVNDLRKTFENIARQLVQLVR